MISHLIDDVVSDISTVKSLISVNEKLRELLTENADPATITIKQHPMVADLLTAVPKAADWRVFEHCATLTRLYAIFEGCISKAVHAWLAELPVNTAGYESLDVTFKGNHRRGVAKVLLDLDKDRFSHLDIATVLSGLMDAVGGKNPYSVLPESFLFDNRSLKRERLDELFAQVCLKGGWNWIGNHRFVIEFIKQIRGGGNTAEAELRTFINYRNDAAHGNIDQVLGPVPLAEYAEFFIAVCRAIGELILWNRTKCRINRGLSVEAGQITERFINNVVVARMAHCTIRVGMEVMCMGDNYCYPVLIESIQLNDVSHQEVLINDKIEVGLRLNLRTQKHPKLFIETPTIQA